MKTILVVDDDETMRLALEEFLEGEGYNTYTAGSVDLARHVISTVPIDLLLTDVVMMPETGPELVAWVEKRHPGKFPVIFMSGSGSVPGYPFLAKPFVLDDLRGLVKRALKEEA